MAGQEHTESVHRLLPVQHHAYLAESNKAIVLTYQRRCDRIPLADDATLRRFVDLVR